MFGENATRACLLIMDVFTLGAIAAFWSTYRNFVRLSQRRSRSYRALFSGGMVVGLLLCVGAGALARLHWGARDAAEVLVLALALLATSLWTLNLLRISLEASSRETETGARLAMENARLQDRQRLADSLLQTQSLVIFALAKITEARDNDTGQHVYRIREYSRILAEELRAAGRHVDQIDDAFLDDLYRTSPLHDIGKVAIPDDILLKPGPLTSQEARKMQTHAELGAEILDEVMRESRSAGFLKMARDIARSHHEWWNGAGYPDGSSGETIPLAARIVAVADVFDAITSKRPYKSADGPELATEHLVSAAGTHFDPEIIEAFQSGYDRILRVHAKYADRQLAEPSQDNDGDREQSDRSSDEPAFLASAT